MDGNNRWLIDRERIPDKIDLLKNSLGLRRNVASPGQDEVCVLFSNTLNNGGDDTHSGNSCRNRVRLSMNKQRRL